MTRGLEWWQRCETYGPWFCGIHGAWVRRIAAELGVQGPCGGFRGDVDSPPKFPTGDAWVVFGDDKLWATRWDGG